MAILGKEYERRHFEEYLSNNNATKTITICFDLFIYGQIFKVKDNSIVYCCYEGMETLCESPTAYFRAVS